jgi:hypothetical protein
MSADHGNSGYKREEVPMRRQSFDAVWPRDKVAVYASERVHAERREAREGFGM